MEGKTAYVGPSSIFRLTPCTEETARRAIEQMIPAQMKVVNLAEKVAITAGAVAEEQDPDYEEPEF